MTTETQEARKRATRECPFPDCDWSEEYDPDSYPEELSADFSSEMHYEKEHAGRIRVQVTIEYERLLSDRDPEDVRKAAMERFEDQGHDVAHVRSEVLEPSDDHSKLGDSERA